MVTAGRSIRLYCPAVHRCCRFFKQEYACGLFSGQSGKKTWLGFALLHTENNFCITKLFQFNREYPDWPVCPDSQ